MGPQFRKIHWSFAQPPYVSASSALNTSSVSAKNQSAKQTMSMSFLMHSLQRKGKSNFIPLCAHTNIWGGACRSAPTITSSPDGSVSVNAISTKFVAEPMHAGESVHEGRALPKLLIRDAVRRHLV